MRHWRTLTAAAAAACALMLALAAPAWASGTTLYVAGLGATYSSAASNASGNNCQVESKPCASIAYALSLDDSDPSIAVAGLLGEVGIPVSSDATVEQDPLDTGAGAEIFGPTGNSGQIFELSGSANLTIEDVTLAGADTTSGSGGAIGDQSSGTLNVDHVVFSSDLTAHDGGAIWVDGSGEVDIADSTFESDFANGNGGAIAVDSAAVVTVLDSTFAENTSGADGGAVYVADANGAATSIVGSTFLDDAAANQVATSGREASVSGNAIYADTATPNLAGNLLSASCSMAGSDSVGDPLDGGYNVATDGSCLPSDADRGTHDVVSPTAWDVYETVDFSRPGGIETVTPGAENPAAGLIPAGTSVPLSSWTGGGSGSVPLCPVTDEQGVASSGACNAGALQSTTPRPVVYVEGSDGSDPNLGAASDSSTCGSEATPCDTIKAAVGSSLALTYHYTDPIIDVDGTVNEYAPSDGLVQLNDPLEVQQDPDSQRSTATISGANGGTNQPLFYITSGGSLMITGVTMTHANPAIYDYDASATDPVTLEDDTFSDDGTASSEGGAIYDSTPSPVSIDRSSFSDNQALDGGSLWIGNGAAVHVDDSSFSGDSASDSGGGIALSDGVSSSSTLWVDDSNFSDESAGIDGMGGAIDVATGNVEGTAHITDTVFERDSANQGGAIANGDYGGPGTIDVSGSIFLDDTGFTDGGAISNGVYGGNGGTASATISNSIFEMDTSYGNGGAIDNADLNGSGTLTLIGAGFDNDGVLAAGADQIGPSWDGGAIDNGDSDGNPASTSAGTLTAVNTTFYGDYLSAGSSGLSDSFEGSTIDEGSTAGDSATVAADLFDAVAAERQVPPSATDVTGAPACTGSFTDGGYNIGTDNSCFGSAPGDIAPSDLDSEIAVLQPDVNVLGSVALNTGDGDSVTVVEPRLLGSSSLIGLIPAGTASPIGAEQLCPVADVLGDSAISGYGGGCVPGALQSYTATAPTLDGYPTGVAAVAAGGGQASVSWTAPSLRAAGGRIDSYTVTPLDVTTDTTGTPHTTVGPVTSLTVDGLNGGDTYTFTVLTNNEALGPLESSGSSDASNAVQIQAVAASGGTTTTTTTTTATSTTPTATTPTSPAPVVVWRGFERTVDHMRLTLRVPVASSCSAPARTATVHLAAVRSGRTPLTFVKAVASLGGKQGRTVKHLSAGVTFTLEGLEAGSHSLKVVFSFRESLPRHRTRLISKTLSGRLSVC